jgi:hypothetical protein
MAYLLKTDGTIHEVKPATGRVFTIGELQGMVGGYIEVVRTHTGDFMVVNEDGKLRGLPPNDVATERYPHGRRDPIVGDVLIATWEELEGDDEDAE